MIPSNVKVKSVIDRFKCLQQLYLCILPAPRTKIDKESYRVDDVETERANKDGSSFDYNLTLG